MAGHELKRKPAVLKKSSFGSRHSRLSANSLRSRREAAHRSRDTVRGYVRLLQKDPEPDIDLGKTITEPPAFETTRAVQPEQAQARLSEIVTITIRDPSPNERRSSRAAKRPNYAVLNSGSQSPNERAEGDTGEFSPSTQLDVISPSKERDLSPKKKPKQPGSLTFDPFVCQRCRETFPTVDVFCRHFEMEHCKPIIESSGTSHSQTYACDRCSFITQDEYDYEKHSVMHMRIKDLVNTKVNGRYHCHRCSFSARSAITICHHLKKHTQEKTSRTFFACTDCTARFVTRNEVLKHQSLIHGKKEIYHRGGPN